jgi:hypothetical protein
LANISENIFVIGTLVLVITLLLSTGKKRKQAMLRSNLPGIFLVI